MNWSVKESGFHKKDITLNGNRFICGNGYLGIRGTMEEYKKEWLPAINLAGIYDKVGEGWREPLNAPNALFTELRIDGAAYALPSVKPAKHEQSLDYRHGIAGRETVWKTKRGTVKVAAEHFAHYSMPHVICMRYRVETDFHAEVELWTGIDSDVWDINGPHYRKMKFEKKGSCLCAEGITQEAGERVVVLEESVLPYPHEEQLQKEEKGFYRQFSFVSEIGREVCLEKYIVIFTSKDGSHPLEDAKRQMREITKAGYEACREKQEAAWEAQWDMSEVYIEGDDEAMHALNYSIYQLQSLAPRHTKELSVGARGLSGQTYKGAVFWDTEMFMLDYFLYTQPKVAKTLLNYRIKTLSGARKKAEAYGCQGAFYAWESQEGGYDACSDYNVTDVFTGRPMRTYFKEKQIHISSAVVHGIMRYIELTEDVGLLWEGGFETILACADFYDSLLVKKVHSDVYELHDVIGPDEYHERVNNNAYTNRMAKYTFDMAIQVIDRFFEDQKPKEEIAERLCEQRARYLEDSRHLFLQIPDENGIIEQFDGYFRLEDASLDTVKSRVLNEKEYWGGAYGIASDTRIIKQADVVTELVLFEQEYDKVILKKNLNYYEPRTEHGSSLSACMYALLSCSCDAVEKAEQYFDKSAHADLRSGGKEWAGKVYIGGTHPAAAGGAYMTAINGFGGVHFSGGEIKIDAKLPETWKLLRFRLMYRGRQYQITESRAAVSVECLS